MGLRSCASAVEEDTILPDRERFRKGRASPSRPSMGQQADDQRCHRQGYGDPPPSGDGRLGTAAATAGAEVTTTPVGSGVTTGDDTTPDGTDRPDAGRFARGA